MKAVILAAGEGTRLRPLTNKRPKGLIKVGNMAIIRYIVEALMYAGIDDIYMVVGYEKEKVMSYFQRKDFRVSIKYIIQKKQLGTANAIYQLRDIIKEDFIVLPGDNVIDGDTLKKLAESPGPCMAVTESSTPYRYGVVSASNGYVDDVIEKPQGRMNVEMISTGTVKFTPDVFEIISELHTAGIYDLSTTIVEYCKKTKMSILQAGRWSDAVYPWDILKLNSLVLKNIPHDVSGLIEENVIIRGNVFIGKGTRIHPGCYIQGPAVIGKNCDIGPWACIYPSTSIGHNATIGPFTKIKNSVIMDDVTIRSHSSISDTVISSGTNIGSHFTSESGKSDVKADDGYHNVEKFGSAIGEDCVIGSSVVFFPGTMLGGSSTVNAGKSVSGYIEQNSRVV